LTKFTLRGVSGAALMLGLAGVASAQTPQTVPASPAPDQTAPAQAQDEPDRVVVTGSFIATTPEDAPKPVEVYTNEDLAEQGSPSVSDFVRSLTVSAGSDLGFGQSSPEVPTGSGFASADLRGLGTNGTLVLVNGRRLASTNGGFGADLNTIPSEALESVEVLKDGASATYGAGAVGGVLNFRTRRDIDSPTLSISKQFYDGSDGQYKIDFLTGWVGDAGNILISLSTDHEDGMMASERDFSSLPFSESPASYTLTASNPGRFTQLSGGFLTAATFTNPGSFTDIPGGYYNPTATPTTAQAAALAAGQNYCGAIGSAMVNQLQTTANAQASTIAQNACAIPTYAFRSLVNETTSYRFYGEANFDVSDSMEFHFDFTYSKNESFINRLPTDAPSSRSTDASVNAACASSCFYVIPVQVNTYTPATATASGTATTTVVRNPFVDDFLARINQGGGTQTLAATDALYTSVNYRPFMFGGIPGNPDGLRRERYHRERVLFNAGVKGEFTEGGMFGFLNGITYDYAGQFNQYTQEFKMPDVIVSRLQNALLGYGGPTCNAVDTVATDYSSAAAFNRTVGIQSPTAPGTGGCQWFNPFASAWQTSLVNGAANPAFNSGAIAGRPSGYANPADLVDWLIGNRTAETQYTSGTFDATFTGEVPGFELPGGSIGWALGAQWRLLERRDSATDPSNIEERLNTQNCPYPDSGVVTTAPGGSGQEVGQRGCATATGAFYGTGRIVITQNSPPEYRDSQTIAFYGEVQLPILDNFNVSASVRRETFNGGKIEGDIWSIAGKYDVTDNLYVRASTGTNFRAEAVLDSVPGSFTDSTTAPTNFSAASSFIIPVRTTIANDIQLENDKTLNIGVGWQSDLGEGRIRASVDFFEIQLEDVVATTAQATILTDVFGRNSVDGAPGAQNNRGVAGIPNNAAASSTGQYANCGANLISFVSFNTPCVTGVTTANNLSQINLQQLNGPGFITNGIDYALDISYPLFGGNIGWNLAATQNLVYKATGYDVGGTIFDTGGHRLGFSNFSRTGNASSRWRANSSIRWSNSEHTFSLRANFMTGFDLEPGAVALLTPVVDNLNSGTGALPDVFSTRGVFNTSYMDFDFTYIYRPEWMRGSDLRLSILNVTDKDPPAAQSIPTLAVGALGYYSGIGNPRGRIIELAVSHKF
jgi:outer membrane cobalamin receptor